MSWCKYKNWQYACEWQLVWDTCNNNISSQCDRRWFYGRNCTDYAEYDTHYGVSVCGGTYHGPPPPPQLAPMIGRAGSHSLACPTTDLSSLTQEAMRL